MTRGPWFQDRGIGTLFLLPISIEGWVALLLLVLLLLASAWIPREFAPPFRIATVLVYLALSYYKSEKL